MIESKFWSIYTQIKINFFQVKSRIYNLRTESEREQKEE